MKFPTLIGRGLLVAIAFQSTSLFAQAPPRPAPAPAAPVAPPGAVAPATPPAVAPPDPVKAEKITPPPAGVSDLRERVPELTALDVQPGGLTADETARRALAASVAVGQKRAELAAADARIRQTMLPFFPQFSVQAFYTRLSPVSADFGQGALVGAQNAGPLTTGPCPNGMGTCVLDSAGQPVAGAEFAIQNLENNYAVVASLSVPLSDYVLRLSHAAASSSASREASRYSLEAEKLRVQTDARALYYNWLRTVGQVSIARKSLERTKARLADARTAFEVGASSKADLLRLEALVANTELAVDQAIANRTLANAQLAIVMEDWNAPPMYSVGQPIVLPQTQVVDDASTRRLMNRAMERRLEVKAVDAAATSLRRGAKAVRAGAYPRLDAVGDVTYANPNQRFFPPRQEWNATWSAGIRATWNINEIFGSDASADELDANLQGNVTSRRGVEAAIRNEVITAQLDLFKAQAAARSNQTALRAAEEAYRVTTDLYKAGQATATEVIESESDLLTSKLGEVNANIDLVIAEIRLRHAVGDDVVAVN